MSRPTHRQHDSQPTATTGPTSSVRSRRGFTLVELLTVVTIVLLLTAVVIPIALPSLEGRQKREAARQLNSFIVGARTRARQTGRPVGIWLERYRDATNANLILDEMCLNVYYAQVPLPYSGDFLDSRVAIAMRQPSGNNPPLYTVQFFRRGGPSDPPWVPSGDVGWSGRLKVGDQIVLGDQQRRYTIVDAPSNPVTGVITNQGTRQDNWVLQDSLGQPMPSTIVERNPNGTVRFYGSDMNPQPPVTFRFTFQPTKSTTVPLQMPGDVAIDLNYSIAEGDSYSFVPRENFYLGPSVYTQNKKGKDTTPDPNPVVITFSPNGTIDRVYRSKPTKNGNSYFPVMTGYRPSGTIYFLIGDRERVPANMDANAQTDNNWTEMSNYWVSIHPQTGMVATTEMYDPDGTIDPNVGVPLTRTFARQGQSMGGR